MSLQVLLCLNWTFQNYHALTIASTLKFGVKRVQGFSYLHQHASEHVTLLVRLVHTKGKWKQTFSFYCPLFFRFCSRLVWIGPYLVLKTYSKDCRNVLRLASISVNESSWLEFFTSIFLKIKFFTEYGQTNRMRNIHKKYLFWFLFCRLCE